MSKIKSQVISGVPYVFERTSFRVPGEGKVRQKRKYLGKYSDDGSFIPNEHFFALSKEEQLKTGLPVPGDTLSSSRGRPAAPTEYTRLFAGATYLFDQLSSQLGVTADLKTCFPGSWKQILSIAWFLVLEERNPLSRFPKWSKTHAHPHKKVIPSPRSSDLFASITEDQIQRFFSLQIRRRLESEYLAYDSTSLSTYSQGLTFARKGKNKEHDHLDQINLLLVFGQQSRIPVFYRALPGNIADVSTVIKLIRDLATLGMGKVKLIMDRGFYSAQNISALYRKHYKFLMAGKCSLKYVMAMINAHRQTICSLEHYVPELDVYAVTRTMSWKVSGTYPSEGKVSRKLYMHLYYNQNKAVERRKAHHLEILRLQQELEDHREDKRHAAKYEKYFIIKNTPKRGRRVTLRHDVVKSEEKDYGFFILLSNCISDAKEALVTYRAKDCVEKAFGNLKERLGFRRPGVSSDSHLQGKIFVQYIALIILSQIQKVMREKKLYSSYTLYTILDELDIIEYYKPAGSAGHWGEITKKQTDVYEAFGVPAPVCIK
jgi:transposase